MPARRTSISHPIALAGLILLIVAACVSLFLSTCDRRPPPPWGDIQMTGRVLAEETAKQVKGNGKIILVARDVEAHKLQHKAIEATFQHLGNLRVDAVEMLRDEDLKPSKSGMIPSALFLGALSKHPDAAAVISLQGAPELNDASALPNPNLKLVVFAPTGVGVRSLLEQKLIHVAIVRRPKAPAMPGQPGSLPPSPHKQPVVTDKNAPPERIRFDQQFLIYTQDSDLSEFFEATPPMHPSPPRP